MTPRHLVAAAAAVALLVAALAGATHYAQRLEMHWVDTLAPQMFAQKHRGIALQRAAFRQSDLLPVYGSSELIVRNPRHASALFRQHPTGFTVFPVGNLGSTNLIWLQALAGVGADLHGKRVAVSLPVRSFLSDAVDAHAYGANFSRLQASELAFSTDLSFAVKQGAAQRMLRYPETVAADPLLRFALEQLASGSWRGRLLYCASLPLGKLHNMVLRLQDHWETLTFLRAQIGLAPVERRAANLDWADLLGRADADARRTADGNPFGFEQAFWTAHAPDVARQKQMTSAAVALRNLEGSAEWTDLELLIAAIKELGGEPLLLSTPMNGAYFDHIGVPQAVRSAYYERLRSTATAHDVDLVDFAEHDADRFFTVNPSLHLSDKGWVHYNRALNDFFHRQPPANS